MSSDHLTGLFMGNKYRYLQNKNNTLLYLDAINDSKKQSQAIKDLLALESLFNQHIQKLQSFEAKLQQG